MYERLEDQQVDKKLNIETTGLIEWPRGVNLDYFRTESSSYRDLDHLIENYDLQKIVILLITAVGKGALCIT